MENSQPVQAVEHSGATSELVTGLITWHRKSQEILSTAYQATDDPPGSVNMLVWAHRERLLLPNSDK